LLASNPKAAIWLYSFEPRGLPTKASAVTLRAALPVSFKEQPIAVREVNAIAHPALCLCVLIA